jgi:AraC-like DNA-binding protein
VSLRGPRKETTVSIRLVWPFARITGTHPQAHTLLQGTGLKPQDFANPDTRIPHRVLMQLLEDSVRLTGDPLLGLRAGESVEAGDFDVLEYAARCAPTLGDAIGCVSRYFRLMNGAAEMTLAEDGTSDTVEWRFRVTDGVRQPPAANDFVIASSLAFSKRTAKTYQPPLEIHFMHERPQHAAAYERLGPGKVKFNAPYNTLVLHRSRLATPMLQANPRVARAFEMHAQQLIERLDARNGIVGRVREEVATQLGTGTVTMHGTARRLAMSVATLRRRLEEQGTTFSSILDDLRKQLAEQYLTEPRSAISEIAFLLGFSDVASFDRAFKRWTGLSPSKFRAALPENRARD